MLPPVIEQLAEVIGIEAVQALIDARLLGFRQRIGRSRECEWYRDWADVIGEGHADAVMKVWAGDSIYFPACEDAVRAERNRRLIAEYDAMLAEGVSARKATRILCRRYRVSDRTIERIVNRPVLDPTEAEKQLNLF